MNGEMAFEDRSFHLDRFRILNHYEVLDVRRDAPFDEINNSYKRALQMFDPLSVATYSILSPEENAVMLRMVESAYSTLRDPVERRRYDRELERTSPPQPALQIAPDSKAPPRKLKPSPIQSSFPFLSPVYSVQMETPGIVNVPEIDMVAATFIEMIHEQSVDAAVQERAENVAEQANDTVDVYAPTEPFGEALSPATEDVEEPPVPLIDPEKQAERVVSPLAEVPSPEMIQTMETMPPAPSVHAEPIVEIPEIGPDTVFSGELIKKIRVLRKLEVSDIAAIIKITKTNIEYIENENYRELPATVYLKGHLVQYAKVLKLDPMRVSTSYIARMKASTQPQES